ncbi:ABC-type transport auxiliary lipoprotein family protein [Dyella telluris]|uniref:Membrane integrity-associated transporter subunit PqiC n=1 Tax=Dyella telluris TaxID=2763498 RepID=A0A7G8Q7G7_9GAMM|nr:ABC-type transport auxiliary lipoprotein family protein [Dyella telluris]QNK02725.1 membrane integrity-associated transporter subunit PqiC [Dyella telluris]
MRLLAHLFAGTAITLLSACSVLPKSEPQEIYRLPATALPHDHAAPVNWSLRVDMPNAERMIDSSRITVLPQGDEMSVYKGARWSDTAPKLLRNRFVDAFRDNGRIAELSSDETSLQADYSLSGDLRAFQSVYENGQPVVVIRFDARLVKNNGLRIVASHRFDITQPVGGTSVPQVVAAFGQATDALASQLVNWTLQQPLDAHDVHTD